MAKRTGKPTKPQTRPPQTSTQEIPASQWITFLTEFTSENRGAHARLEVLGPDIGYQVQTDNRPFLGHRRRSKRRRACRLDKLRFHNGEAFHARNSERESHSGAPSGGQSGPSPRLHF
jgi:hypothetical protein